MFRPIKFAVSVLLVLGSTGLSAGILRQGAGSVEFESLYRLAVERPFDESVFKRFKESLPHDTAGTYYVVEGDLRMTEEELRAYLVSVSAAPRSHRHGGELKVNVVGGQLDYWKEPSSRNLTYAVDRRSFSPTEHAKVVENMRLATADWVASCPDCGIRFTHLSQHDRAPSLDAVTFIVVKNRQPEGYVAMAFFPGQPKSFRLLRIDPSYFTTSFDRVGVLRHELGHVLGYRHEHIAGIPGCYREDANWLPLSPYDPHSVMHYFCGGGGSLDLRITDIDKTSHASLYAGRP
jgi:hypothetical protein